MIAEAYSCKLLKASVFRRKESITMSSVKPVNFAWEIIFGGEVLATVGVRGAIGNFK